MFLTTHGPDWRGTHPLTSNAEGGKPRARQRPDSRTDRRGALNAHPPTPTWSRGFSSGHRTQWWGTRTQETRGAERMSRAQPGERRDKEQRGNAPVHALPLSRKHKPRLEPPCSSRRLCPAPRGPPELQGGRGKLPPTAQTTAVGRDVLHVLMIFLCFS